MSIRDAVDREIAAMVTTLKVLATSAALESGDFASFQGRAATGLEGTPSFVALVDAKYHVLLSTRVPFGVPLGTISNKEAVDAPLKSGDSYVSNVFFGARANEPVFLVALPVTVKGSPYVLIMSRGAASLIQVINDLKLPSGWGTTLIDGTGNVISSVGEAKAGEPSKFAAFAAEGDANGATIGPEGDRIVYAVRKSFNTGWHAAAWVPASVVEAPLWKSISLLLVEAGALVALTGLLAFWFARGVSRPILALADRARALGHGEAVKPLNSRISEANEVSAALAAASNERRESEDQIRFLMRELSHRAKNQLAIVTAMARRTGDTSGTMEEFQAVFSDRLLALSRSMDLLVKQNWNGVVLSELVAAQLHPFETGERSRIVIEGPRVQLNADVAQNIGLVLHELATNAAKYGALSVPGGKVSVRWGPIPTDPGVFRISWVESGGPPVGPQSRTGFGSFVIQRAVTQALGGDVSHEFDPSGVTWTLDIATQAIEARPVAR
jgi:two-component sensor histidine kinase